MHPKVSYTHAINTKVIKSYKYQEMRDMQDKESQVLFPIRDSLLL
jgi:hypothetical protein